MSLRNYAANGFKFSFKREQSCKSTPKFTSIQLSHNSLSSNKIHTSMHDDQLKKFEKNNKKSQQKLETKQCYRQKQRQNKSNSLLDLLRENQPKERKRKTNDSYQELRESLRKSKFPNAGHSQSSRPTQGNSNRKNLFGSRDKVISFKKNKSLERLFKDPLPNTQIKKQQKSNQFTEQKQTNLTYLQIFKKQKKRVQSKSKTSIKHSHLNLSLKTLEKPEQPFATPPQPAFQKHTSSPRSYIPLSQTPKIKTQYFSKPSQIQELMEGTSFPNTEKSQRFNEESAKINHFFRKNQNKKNFGNNSKALFKLEKTNLQIRLGGVSGAVSKLNIHID